MPLHLVPPIHRATHRIGLYLATLREDGLSQGEAHILALLAKSGAATIGQLHRGLAHKRSTLTSILDRLVARGLATRTVGDADRRTFVVALTARGRRVAARVRRHIAALERAVARRATPGEMRACLKVIGIVESEAHSRCSAKASAARRRPGVKRALG
jgi:DNA-binding MarR family transcriptional regulator